MMAFGVSGEDLVIARTVFSLEEAIKEFNRRGQIQRLECIKSQPVIEIEMLPDNEDVPTHTFEYMKQNDLI